MKENIINGSLEMIDKLLEIVSVDLTDDLDKQIVSAYFFGMLNGKAHQESLAPTDVQAIMIRVGVDKLGYPTQAAYQMTQFVIGATDKDFHPTVNTIIHRGINAYYLYVDKKYEKLKADFQSIMAVLRN